MTTIVDKVALVVVHRRSADMETQLGIFRIPRRTNGRQSTGDLQDVDLLETRHMITTRGAWNDEVSRTFATVD